MHFDFFQTWSGNFSFPWMPFQNQKTKKEFHRSSCLYKMISYFWDTISKHCKWIMLLGPAFLNDSGHIKTMKIITRNVGFRIPTLEIFLNKKRFLRTVGIIGVFFIISTWTSAYCWYSNHVLGSLNKCSLSKKPQLICNRLILSKFYCFDIKASWWGCFKGVSSLSDLCSAKNVDDLLNYITNLVVICLLPKPDDSTDDVTKESSEDKDSEKNITVFCAIQTHYSYLISYIRTHSFSLIASSWRNVSSNYSLDSFIICITSETCEYSLLSGWSLRAREQYDF